MINLHSVKVWLFFLLLTLFSVNNIAFAQSVTGQNVEINSKSLVDIPDVFDAALSPSGDDVVYLRSQWETAATRDWDIAEVISKNNPKAARTLIKQDDFIANWVAWPKKDRILISAIEVKWSKRSYTLYDEIISVDSDTGKQLKLYSSTIRKFQNNYRPARILFYSQPDDPYIIISVNNGKSDDVVRFDIYSGESKVLEHGNTSTIDWFISDNGVPIMRYDMDEDSQIISIYARAKETDKWTLQAKIFPNQKNDFDVIAESDEVGKVYVIATPDGEDRAAVWLYDLANQKYEKKIFENERYDVAGAFVSGRPRKYSGAYYFDDILRYKFEDPILQDAADNIQAKLGNEKRWSLYDTDFIAENWLIISSGPRDAGTYWHYKFKTHELTRLSGIRDDVPDEILAQSKPFYWKAKDGLDLSGYVTYPKIEAATYPLIVMPHGGPELRDYLEFDAWTQFFASRGFIVFQPNFRGSSGFGRKFREAGFGQWGQKMQTDIEDGVDALVAGGKIDKNKMIIIGSSYGGYAALSALTSENSRYACGVSVSGVSDLISQIDFEKSLSKMQWGKDLADYWMLRMGNPATDSETMKKVSPLNNVSNLKVPLLLVHGKNDKVVPYSQSKQFYEAAQKLNKKVQIQYFDDEGHSNWDSDNEVRLLWHIDYFVLLCVLNSGHN